MRTLISLVLIASGFLLADCSIRPPEPGSPAAIAKDDEQKLRSEQTLDLCDAFAAYHQPAVRGELIRRNALTPEDWARVDKQQIEIGMSTCGMYAAWGKPQSIKRSVTSAHSLTEYNYPARRLYVEDGRIVKFKTLE
jgi:hypothetical protein